MIDALSLGDLERCLDLAEKVGWPRERAKWEIFFALGRGFCTREGDALTSMVMLPAHDGATFVAMMVVDPAQQGRGLGRALLEHALPHAKAPVLLYATAAGRPLYERLGFHVVDHVRKWIGEPAAIAHAKLRSARRAEVIDLDTRAFGADRSRMLDEILARADIAVADDRGGFAVRWHNGALPVIGPVVAEDDEAAIELVSAALAGARGEVRIDVAQRAERLDAWVRTTLGLRDYGPAPLMSWPEPVTLGERHLYRAIALQGLG